MYVCIICVILIKHTLPVMAIVALCQLVHLGTRMYGYMFLAYRIQTKLKITLEQQGQLLYMQIYIYIYIERERLIIVEYIHIL